MNRYTVIVLVIGMGLALVSGYIAGSNASVRYEINGQGAAWVRLDTWTGQTWRLVGGNRSRPEAAL